MRFFSPRESSLWIQRRPVLRNASRWNNALDDSNSSKVVIVIATECTGQGLGVDINKPSKPYSEKQRRFLEEKFRIGETTERKLDPVTVARQLRVARGSDWQRQFTPEELLTAKIQGSRFKIQDSRLFFPAEQNLRIKQWLKLKMISL